MASRLTGPFHVKIPIAIIITENITTAFFTSFFLSTSLA